MRSSGMNFMQLIQSLDDLLYEIMSWLVFFPLTLVRTIRHPLAMMEYAALELHKPSEKQFEGSMSPPLFLLLALLISHAIELASGGGTNPIVASHRGLAAFVDSDTKLLLLRLMIFSLIPLTLATTQVVASKAAISDATLKPLFYSQCYPAASFALSVGIGGVLLDRTKTFHHLGAGIMLAALFLYFILQVVWFRNRLQCGIVMGAVYAGSSIVGGLLFAFFVGILFI